MNSNRMMSWPDRRFLSLGALASVAVALYACALPLWEGWDEPFHYGYVESLSVFHEFPVLGESSLTAEIAESLRDSPLPGYLAGPVQGATSFPEWHLMPETSKSALRTKLLAIPTSARCVRGANPNYEAQQTPLAYALLMPFDWLVSNVELLRRIVLLRLIESIAAMCSLLLGLRRLGTALRVPEPLRPAAVFCCICTQTLWASLAHISNDGVAIAMTVWFCVLLTENKQPLTASFVFAAGLLTKAYFLAFAPVFYVWLLVKPTRWRGVAAILPLLIAGPWYLRNVVLYRSLSGTQETAQWHVTFASAISAAGHVNWLRSLSTFSRASLWDGNWSSVTFGKGALYAEALLMAAGLALCAIPLRPKTAWLWATAASLAAALVYQTCVTWVATGGVLGSPEPWYVQGVLASSWMLVFSGFEAKWRYGKILAIALCSLTAVIAILSFPLVLLPYYAAGLKFGAAVRWWLSSPLQDLRLVLPSSVIVVLVLLALFTTLLIWNGAVILWRLYTTESPRHPM